MFDENSSSVTKLKNSDKAQAPMYIETKDVAKESKDQEENKTTLKKPKRLIKALQ